MKSRLMRPLRLLLCSGWLLLAACGPAPTAKTAAWLPTQTLTPTPTFSPEPGPPSPPTPTPTPAPTRLAATRTPAATCTWTPSPAATATRGPFTRVAIPNLFALPGWPAAFLTEDGLRLVGRQGKTETVAGSVCVQVSGDFELEAELTEAHWEDAKRLGFAIRLTAGDPDPASSGLAVEFRPHSGELLSLRWHDRETEQSETSSLEGSQAGTVPARFRLRVENVGRGEAATVLDPETDRALLRAAAPVPLFEGSRLCVTIASWVVQPRLPSAYGELRLLVRVPEGTENVTP